jgi:hypothetical protein
LIDGRPFDAEVILHSGAVVRLKGAVVSSYTVGSSGDPPSESWSLNAESVEFVQPEKPEESPAK